MNRRLRIAAWAGLALIVATNAVALAGAAFNRAGEPQATLKLSERELSPPYFGYGKVENSGLSLRLHWQSLPSESRAKHGRSVYYSKDQPGWLDARKMRELGFDAPAALPRHSFDSRSPRRDEPPREVFIVLEFDGPAYQEFVRRASVALDEADAEQPRSIERVEAASDAAKAARLDTRLFAIDAGLDDAALRARHPDRTMIAIVRGRVAPAHNRDDEAGGGYVEDLAITEINVPLALRPMFGAIDPQVQDNRMRDAHYEATVMFGQRAEPWLAGAERR